uniref:Protein kinase domain-containing protein n=1 Tax=Periophthalmus magnuspinnatus TaxID=409849 RepID=A0A3B3ZNH1_9GOBI
MKQKEAVLWCSKTSFDRYTDPETKYEVLEALGEGVFGTVTKCRNRATNQIVVLKVMKKDEKMCLNFKRELEMLEHISPVFNLVKFIEFFDFQDRQSMVFEMLDISVYDLMQEEFPFSLSQARPVAKQLLIALQGLQDIAVIHADIKPDNIMLVNHREQPFKMMQPISVRAPEVRLGLPLWEAHSIYNLEELIKRSREFVSEQESNDRDAFHDLLSKMLEINAEKRITPAQALLHPFITMDHLPKGDNYTKEAHELMRVAETMYGPLQRENLEKIAEKQKEEAIAANDFTGFTDDGSTSVSFFNGADESTGSPGETLICQSQRSTGHYQTNGDVASQSSGEKGQPNKSTNKSTQTETYRRCMQTDHHDCSDKQPLWKERPGAARCIRPFCHADVFKGTLWGFSCSSPWRCYCFA